MGESKFRNVATITGKVKRREFKNNIGNGLLEVFVDADGNSIKMQKWNTKNNANAAEEFSSQFEDGGKYRFQGNLSERENEGNVYREVKCWNSVNEVGEDDEERAVLALAGDVLDINMAYPNTADVKGFDYKEDVTPKVDIKILYFNTYNSDGEDYTREQVLINEIQRYGDYCKENNIDANFDDLKSWMNILEDIGGMSNVLDVYDKFSKTSANIFNITELTVVALGDIAEQIAGEVEKGDNLELGVFIENKFGSSVEYDFFGNPVDSDDNQKGGENYSRLKIGKYKVLEKCLVEESKAAGGSW